MSLVHNVSRSDWYSFQILDESVTDVFRHVTKKKEKVATYEHIWARIWNIHYYVVWNKKLIIKIYVAIRNNPKDKNGYEFRTNNRILNCFITKYNFYNDWID